jgi:hypothetical protein
VFGLIEKIKQKKRTLGQQLHDGTQFIFETDFENAIGFIDDQALQILEHKASSVLQVKEAKTWMV